MATTMIEVAPFGAEHLDGAADLLAARHERLRARRPELPERYLAPAASRELLSALLERPGAHGVGALLDGRLVAFLIGFARSEPIWDRACWSPVEGQACAPEAGAETMRDLYAAWSRFWVERGVFRHYAHAPADDPELLDAWFSSGFGKMQVHAVRELDPAPQAGARADLTIRRATPGDIDAVARLAPLISLALMDPPAYAAALPETFPTYREAYAEELEDADAHIWLALDGDRALGMAAFYEADPGPMVPDGAWELSVAMTEPTARRGGVARALLAAGSVEAREAGAGHLVVDWRIASLVTDRTWRALGFRPTHFRLHRHVDERIAWAAAFGMRLRNG